MKLIKSNLINYIINFVSKVSSSIEKERTNYINGNGACVYGGLRSKSLHNSLFLSPSLSSDWNILKAKIANITLLFNKGVNNPKLYYYNKHI